MGKLPRKCFVMLSLTFPFVLELMKMQFLLLCHRTLSLASFRPWCRYTHAFDKNKKAASDKLHNALEI